MIELILRLLRLVRGGAGAAVDGLGRLNDRLEKRLDKQDQRLDDCEKDRNLLRSQADEIRYEMSLLRIRTEECEDDRRDLRKEMATMKDKIETLEENTAKQ